MKVELRQYRAAEFCDLLTKATGSRAQFTVDDPFRCQIAPFFPGGAPIWDWLERLHQDTGWEVEAKDEKTLLLRRRA